VDLTAPTPELPASQHRLLLELGRRLESDDGVEAALEQTRDALSAGLGAGVQCVRGGAAVLHEPDAEIQNVLEAARHGGQPCSGRGSSGFGARFVLALPVRRDAAPCDLLVLSRATAFSELEQALARLAVALLETALRQHAARRELRDSRSQLEQSERIKSVGQLASGIAHDFNNLLMVISAAAEVMADGLTPEHPCAPQLGLILDTSQRAAQLTKRLLAFSRKAQPAMLPMNLNELIGTLREFLLHSIDRRITLSFAPCIGACMVDADGTQLGNALLNVCLNARDSMPDGGRLEIGTHRLDLDASECALRHPGCAPGPYVRVDIKDTGTGMDAETLERAFEPFFTTKEPGRGTGLGLSVALAAVREHKGSVQMRSEPGGGTLCSLFLPLCDRLSEEVPKSGPGLRGTAALRVLLVDDEPSVCRTAAQLMRQLGHNVQALCSGEKALSHLRTHSSGYDLLVLDVMMPHPTGLEVRRALSREGIELPTVFMSGSSNPSPLGAISEHAGAVFLQKPFRLADFEQAIARCMADWPGRELASLRAG
jgi:signal transduction histidine kinase/ActR/RegA family two-component response regulator